MFALCPTTLLDKFIAYQDLLMDSGGFSIDKITASGNGDGYNSFLFNISTFSVFLVLFRPSCPIGVPGAGFLVLFLLLRETSSLWTLRFCSGGPSHLLFASRCS